MIKCRHCGKPASKNATITERGTVSTYTLSRNPPRGQIGLTLSSVSCGDEHELELTCTYCGEDTVLSKLATSGAYKIETPVPTQSETHSTCDNCSAKYENGKLEQSAFDVSRLDPGSMVPSGECPSCGSFCYPSTD
jgi:hypothetical protein